MGISALEFTEQWPLWPLIVTLDFIQQSYRNQTYHVFVDKIQRLSDYLFMGYEDLNKQANTFKY